jgi:hypothetical protein
MRVPRAVAWPFYSSPPFLCAASLLLFAAGTIPLPAHGFATVQSLWGACRALQPSQAVADCMCDPSNFALRLPFAVLADGPAELGLWTGSDSLQCSEKLSFVHGAVGQPLATSVRRRQAAIAAAAGNQTSFLAFVSWLWLYGEHSGRADIVEAAQWMAVDPITDGVSLFPRGQGGIEGKGFTLELLYAQILPLATGLDRFLLSNNSCGYDQIVAHPLPRVFAGALFNATRWAKASGAAFPDVGQSTWEGCTSAWGTSGLSQWMGAFIAPVTLSQAREQVGSHVRFNPQQGNFESAMAVYEETVSCSLQAFTLWQTALGKTFSHLDALNRVAKSSAAVEAFIEQMMRAGACGAPAY